VKEERNEKENEKKRGSYIKEQTESKRDRERESTLFLSSFPKLTGPRVKAIASMPPTILPVFSSLFALGETSIFAWKEGRNEGRKEGRKVGRKEGRKEGRKRVS
jgi:hypothetical protein